VGRQTVTAEEFSTFVADLDLPVFVVTTAHDGERSGCLVGFATQVSIEPPQMLVCISENNHTHRLAGHAEHVAVHLLSPDQHDLASLFGEETGDQIDKFERCAWHSGAGGVPVLQDAARSMVGRVLHRVPFADHLGLLLDPVETTVTGRAAAFGLRQASHLEPGHPA
jgi:flavin reductase (DIM6/NTAB) family NADH-FMN oxidoreductase RutF